MWQRVSSLLVILVALTVLAFSSGVSANGLPSTSDNWDKPSEALVTIFILNVLVNLMLFSGFLLLSCMLLGKNVGEIFKRQWLFLLATIAAAIVITAIGAVVDFVLLLGEYPFGYGLSYDPVLWLAAISVIFVSILAAALFFLSLSLKGALVPAVAMSALNPVWWYLSLTMTPEVVVLGSLLLSCVMAPLFLLGLSSWHSRTQVNKGSAGTSAQSAT